MNRLGAAVLTKGIVALSESNFILLSVRVFKRKFQLPETTTILIFLTNRIFQQCMHLFIVTVVVTVEHGIGTVITGNESNEASFQWTLQISWIALSNTLASFSFLLLTASSTRGDVILSIYCQHTETCETLTKRRP